MTKENIVYSEHDLKIKVLPNSISRVYQSDGLSKVFHEDIEIKYFVEGSSTLVVDQETIVTQPRDVIVINPYEFHSTIDLNNQVGKYHLFMIGLDFFEASNIEGLNLRNLFMVKKRRFHHVIRNNERMGQILLRIVEEYSRKEQYYERIIQGLMLEFFSLLMRHAICSEQMNEINSENVRYYSIIEPAVEQIRHHYDKKLTVEQLADLCNISKCHFCRIFKLVTQMTVVEYITDYRFKIADLMLAYSNKTVSQIAELCGFEDASYFCRCYRKKIGITPNKNKELLMK